MKQTVENLIFAEFQKCDVSGMPLSTGACKALEYQQKFKSLFNCNTSILVIDPETGCIEDANDHALAFYGYRHDEITNMTIYDINRLTDFEIKKKMSEARGKDQNYFIFPHVLKSGEIRTVKVYSTPIMDIGRELLFSIIQDVTEEERLARANEYNEKLYAYLFDNNESGIVLLDLQTRITNANGRFRKMFEMDHDIEGKRLMDVLADEAIRGESQLLTQIATSGYSHSINTIRKTSKGESFPVNIQVLPVYIKGEMRSIFVVYSSLSDEMVHEAVQQNAMAELEAKERIASLNYITRGITQEMHSPLGICLSNISFFEEELKNLEQQSLDKSMTHRQMKEQIQTFNEAIQLTKASLMSMHDRLKNLEIVAQEIESEKRANVKETLLKVLFQYQSRLDEKRIGFEYEVDNDLEAKVGPTFLEIIFLTLFDNILHHGFTDHFGGRVFVKAYADETHVSIEVLDNGAGISENSLRHIFDPYYTTRSMNGHLGKGLTFIYDVLTRLNIGLIEAKSEVGKHTCITVKLNQ